MAQLSIERHDSIEKEESFICETAKLAQLVAEQGEQKILIQNECCEFTTQDLLFLM